MGQVARLAHRLDVHWIDVAIVAILTVFAIVQGSPQDGQEGSPAVLLAIVPLLVRRRWPIAVLGAALLGLGIAGNSTDLSALIGGLIAAVSVGLYSRNQNVAIAAVTAAAIIIALEFGRGATSTLPVPGAILPFLLLGAAYLAGREIGSRQKALHEQREAAGRQAAEHETALKAAAEAERRRIARELHDVVAHSVSVMVVQAGAARQVLSEKPAAAREALLNVETVGHEAMAELRRLLGVLADNGADPALLAPEPRLDRLPALIERIREAGLPVQLRVEGESVALAADLDSAAYRIVQEALTNVLKYGGGAPTEVVVRYGADSLDLEVIDEGTAIVPSDAIGRGLIGMRERVAIFGGRIEAGKRPSRGYAVHAQLPLAATSAETARLD
ncbi:MAG TPA: histidine kinase [Candidatus Dormibacteraeota bacterium]